MTIVQLNQLRQLKQERHFESDSYIDVIEGLNSEVVMLFQDINEDCGINPSYKPESMEMDGTYDHSIEILLTFFMVLNQKVYAMSTNI